MNENIQATQLERGHGGKLVGVEANKAVTLRRWNEDRSKKQNSRGAPPFDPAVISPSPRHAHPNSPISTLQNAPVFPFPPILAVVSCPPLFLLAGCHGAILHQSLFSWKKKCETSLYWHNHSCNLSRVDCYAPASCINACGQTLHKLPLIRQVLFHYFSPVTSRPSVLSCIWPLQFLPR